MCATQRVAQRPSGEWRRELPTSRGHPGRLSSGGGACPEPTISSSASSAPPYAQAPSGRGCAVRHTRHTPVQEALTPSCATSPRSPRDSESERVEVAHARSRQHDTRFGQDCTELAASSPSERLERENAETNGERWESETPGTGPRAKIKARKSH